MDVSGYHSNLDDASLSVLLVFLRTERPYSRFGLSKKMRKSHSKFGWRRADTALRRLVEMGYLVPKKKKLHRHKKAYFALDDSFFRKWRAKRYEMRLQLARDKVRARDVYSERTAKAFIL